MLINPYRFNSYDEKLIGIEYLKESNILSNKRRIYIIKKYENNIIEGSIFDNYQTNNIILVNLSKSIDDTGEVYNYYKNIYTFSSITPKGDAVGTFLESKLTLMNTSSTGFSTIDKDYKDLGIIYSYDHTTNPVQVSVSDPYSEDELIVDTLDTVDPRYYTKLHYEKINGVQFESLPSSGKSFYTGKELIDESTEIYYINKKYGYDDSITYEKNNNGNILVPNRSKFNHEIIEQLGYVNSIPVNLFRSNLESFLSSYEAIYDSRLGVNLINVEIPKFVDFNRKLEYFDIIKKEVTDIGDKMKSLYGDIRIMYHHSNFEDCTTVLFDSEEINKIATSINRSDLLESVIVNLNINGLEETIDSLLDRVDAETSFHKFSGYTDQDKKVTLKFKA